MVRNPTKSDLDYTGPWRDNDPIWLDKENNYAAQVPYVNSSDGIFFISKNDFHIGFDRLSIAF